MTVLLTWSSLWDQYPDYVNYPDPAQVKKLVGGEADEGWIVNTCAIRLSRALNYNGVPVPKGFPGLLTVKGGDAKRYALRVAEVRKWLPQAIGKPAFDVSKKRNDPFDKAPISTLKGIIGFDVRFTDATGHLDLWDGSAFSSEQNTIEDYWTPATRITLWTTTG